MSAQEEASQRNTPTVRKISASEIAPNRRRGGDLRVMLSPLTVGSTSGFMGCGYLQPGEYVSEHYHPYSEEFLYVIQGHLAVRLDGEYLDLAPGEAVMIPIGVKHRFEHRGESTVTVVFHLSPLAPRPDLGHVDCEELPGTGSLPTVGGSA